MHIRTLFRTHSLASTRGTAAWLSLPSLPFAAIARVWPPVACGLWPVALRPVPVPGPSNPFPFPFPFPFPRSHSLSLTLTCPPPPFDRPSVCSARSLAPRRIIPAAVSASASLCLDVSATATATALNSPLPSPPIQHVANFLSFANPDSHRIPIPDPYRP